MLLNIEETSFQKGIASVFTNNLLLNCQNRAFIKSVNRKLYFEFKDHSGRTISMDGVLLEPEYETQLSRTKLAINLARHNQEQSCDGAPEDMLIRLEA